MKRGEYSGAAKMKPFEVMCFFPIGLRLIRRWPRRGVPANLGVESSPSWSSALSNTPRKLY